MKTLVLSMISIAATVAAMTACTSESDGIDDLTKDAPVEIKMSAKVLNIETKSEGPIDGLKKAIDQVGFIRKDATVATESTAEETAKSIDWATETTDYTANIETTGAMTLSPTPYYPAAEDSYAYLIGYHPNTTKPSKGIVAYTIDGNTDIMYAKTVYGYKKTTDKLAPAFNHLLSQLVIKVAGENNAALEAWGTISSISVKGVQKKQNLKLSDGSLTPDGTDNTATSLEIKAQGGTYPTLTTSTTDAGYCMIPPQTTVAKILLTVTTNKTSRDVEVSIPAETGGNNRPADTTVAGEAYTITLTFKASEITAQATVASWKEVTGGQGTVD